MARIVMVGKQDFYSFKIIPITIYSEILIPSSSAS